MQLPVSAPIRMLAAALVCGPPLAAQVDGALAAEYIAEAKALWEHEAQRTWGVSLAGPMVFFDARTQTIATSQPEPDSERPAMLGYANAVTQWGDERWSTYVWQHVPKHDQLARARLLIHELTHRVQPELGHFQMAAACSHMDTLEGRYFVQLEWRALAKALSSSGAVRAQALSDAFGFRQVRHDLFPKGVESERCDVIREGLAQYTAVRVVHPEPEDAAREVQRQLLEFAERPSFVGDFSYPTGAAYGVLLDAYAPGWTREFKPEDDLGTTLMTRAKIVPTEEVDLAAEKYGGSDLMLAEERREQKHLERVATFKKRYIEGPVLVLPRAENMSFTTAGKTAIPGAGTMFPSLRTTSSWGKLEADWALVSEDQQTVTLCAPTEIGAELIRGEHWSLTLAPGWSMRPGKRAGDFVIGRW